MKNIKSDMLILLVGALALLLTLNSMAATTASLIIRGTVSSVLNISIDAEPNALILPLTVTQTDLKVATLHTQSNSSSGYKVSVSTLNQGKLTRVGGSEVIPYVLKVGGSTINTLATDELDFTFVSASPIDRGVTISYTGVNEADFAAGNYQDSITFTISAN